MWDRLRHINPIYFIVILLLIAVGYLNPRFVELNGFLAFIRRAAPLMVLTAGQVYVLVSGGFDLSAGSMISFVVIASALMIFNDPTRTWWVILILLGIGVLVGLINGAVVSYLKVPSLIATLGMLLMLRGAGLYWSGGAPRGYLPDNFRLFGRGNIEPFPLIDKLPYAVVVLFVVGGIADLHLSSHELWPSTAGHWRQSARGATLRRLQQHCAHAGLRRSPRSPQSLPASCWAALAASIPKPATATNAGHLGRRTRRRGTHGWPWFRSGRNGRRPGAGTTLHPAQLAWFAQTTARCGARADHHWRSGLCAFGTRRTK